MQFDDRLSTVLRKRAGSAAGARTQFRQLLDLLGSGATKLDRGLNAEAGTRLADLCDAIEPDVQTQILREPGLRLRNAELVEALAWAEPKVAASSMAMAQLGEHDWLTMIPRLPTAARGFLRHRRDLPARVRRQLDQLGIGDLVFADPGLAEFETVAEEPVAIPEIAAAKLVPVPAPAPTPTPAPAPTIEPQPAAKAESADSPDTPDSIATLLQRIERFRGTRRTPSYAPRLPLGDNAAADAAGRIEMANVRCDANGVVTWASSSTAPWLIGMVLTAPKPGPLVRFGDATTGKALRRQQPLSSALITIDAAPGISGQWWLDATPVFASATGAFEGYRVCLRRAADLPAPSQKPSNTGDHTRELLHELRTPVNAIQGFAEIIQQQLFGPAPHEYRAHAAAIAVDAAKLLAGFDEVDRLTKLESDALDLDSGAADLRECVGATLHRLTGVLEPRGAGFDLTVAGSPFTTAMSKPELAQLIWRILATVAGSLNMGEHIRLDMIADEERLRIKLDWPDGLRQRLEENKIDTSRRAAISAGMFHPRFTLRLADAEARAAGGKLKLGEKRITLTLPPHAASGTQEPEQTDDAAQVGA